MWSVTTEALALADRLEQVAVRHHADALVPGLVAGREMGGATSTPGPSCARAIATIFCFASSGLLRATRYSSMDSTTITRQRVAQ
jgi:hypothetical protein